MGLDWVQLSPGSNEILGRAGEARSREERRGWRIHQSGEVQHIRMHATPLRAGDGDEFVFLGCTKKRASCTRTCKENVNGAAEDAFISSLRVLSRRRDRVVRVRAA